MVTLQGGPYALGVSWGEGGWGPWGLGLLRLEQS